MRQRSYAKVKDVCAAANTSAWTICVVLPRAQAAAALAEFGWVITLDNYKRAGELKGVGKGTVAKIEEFLTTGEIQEVAEFLDDPVEKAATELGKVHGIGTKKAGELAAAGIRGIADLRSRPDTVEGLNEVQRKGLRWVREMHTPTARKTLEQLRDSMTAAVQAADAGFQLTFAGAFRRGEAELGAGETLPIMVTHTEHTLDDPNAVSRVLKRDPDANRGPAKLGEVYSILKTAGFIVEDLEGGTLTRTCLVMDPAAAAVYNTPPPVGESASAKEVIQGDAAIKGAVVAGSGSSPVAAAPKPAPVAAAGLAIPDLDDAEEASEAAATSVQGVWSKHGGLKAARAAVGQTLGGRKRRADGPAVEMLQEADEASEDAGPLQPIDGPCPVTITLNIVPANFAVPALFALTGPQDFVLNVGTAARKVGYRLTKYALCRITALEGADGETKHIQAGGACPGVRTSKQGGTSPSPPLAFTQRQLSPLPSLARRKRCSAQSFLWSRSRTCSAGWRPSSYPPASVLRAARSSPCLLVQLRQANDSTRLPFCAGVGACHCTECRRRRHVTAHVTMSVKTEHGRAKRAFAWLRVCFLFHASFIS